MDAVLQPSAVAPALDFEREAHDAFARSLKPRLAQLLGAFRLDIRFHRALGDFLYYRDGSREVEVLDLIGGFGASLLGHNHPELVAVAREALETEMPFHAQASLRGYAGLLAQAISARLQRATGREFVITLANSGAEAVEAAIKHAEFERRKRNDRLLRKSEEDARKLRIALRQGSIRLAEDFLQQAAVALGCGPLASVDAALSTFQQAVRNAVEGEGVLFAINGSFHGKSTGALKLTHRAEFRRPWRGLGTPATFIPREDGAALAREIRRATITFPFLSLDPAAGAAICTREVVNVTACFVEPIQGEGGIHELSAGFMQSLRDAADRHAFPLVIDEIQAGLGRCGSFLASSASGVSADYYLFSKALGGGLAKVSALAVERERYDAEFGYLHTSTFADDDFSSALALRALEILDRDDQALMKRCTQVGDYLLQRLGSLRERFPNQVRDVRGRGLMLGIELAPQSLAASPLLKVLSEQNYLTYLASGYLLHQHGIRVLPTLSERAVLRIEPSAYISYESCDHVCRGIEDFLIRWRNGETARMVQFLLGEPGLEEPAPRPEATPPSNEDRKGFRPIQGCAESMEHIGFLVNFTAAGDLGHWDEQLRPFSEASCARFLDQTGGVLQPFVLDRDHVRSALGERVALTVIGVPFTPQQAIESMRDGSDWCLDLVREAIEMARGLGCSVVGLGGHTSIVADSGRSLVEEDLALTSGNSLTVAAAHEALFKAMRRMALPSTCRLGVVGGAGNVGATLAELAADQVASIALIGRSGSERFLRPVAQRIYAAAFDSLCAGREASGIARAIAGTRTVARLRSEGSHNGSTGAILEAELAQEMGELAPLRIGETTQSLRDCSLIVSATNSPKPVVMPAHIGHRPTVICDVAVPRDVDPAVRAERPNAVVIRGGIVRAPLGQKLGIPAMRLQGSELYGCLAESILLGFMRYRGHYSYGPVSPVRTREILGWAMQHGFEIVDE